MICGPIDKDKERLTLPDLCETESRKMCPKLPKSQFPASTRQKSKRGGGRAAAKEEEPERRSELRRGRAGKKGRDGGGREVTRWKIRSHARKWSANYGRGQFTGQAGKKG